jgi:YD repeat-containing protein
MGANSLLVFVDDRLVNPSMYTEISSQSILFNDDIPIDPTRVMHEIEVVAGNTDTWEESNNHQVTYVYNLDESIASETISVGAATIKTIAFEYDEEGNVTSEVITKGTKVITKNYYYDVNGNLINLSVQIS